MHLRWQRTCCQGSKLRSRWMTNSAHLRRELPSSRSEAHARLRTPRVRGCGHSTTDCSVFSSTLCLSAGCCSYIVANGMQWTCPSSARSTLRAVNRVDQPLDNRLNQQQARDIRRVHQPQPLAENLCILRTTVTADCDPALYCASSSMNEWIYMCGLHHKGATRTAQAQVLLHV